MAHSITAPMRWRSAPGRLDLHGPDRRQDLQLVGARHLGDRPDADAREGVAFEGWAEGRA